MPLKQPNFVLVLTDDLDVMMGSSSRTYLPKTWGRVADAGTVFNNVAVRTRIISPT